MQKQRVRRWNGAILSCSTKASNSFTQNARQIETGRSAKHEANNRLYMTQPLRQNVAIWIVVICVLEAGPHLFHLFPSSILQSEGLWQHKGLGKHNTISVASSILTCNGLATLKGSPPGCIYRSHLDRKGLCWAFPSWWPHSANNHKSQWGDTFNGHHSVFFTNSSVEQVDWPHSHTPTNHELTAHVADKETLLLNCHCTF